MGVRLSLRRGASWKAGLQLLASCLALGGDPRPSAEGLEAKLPDSRPSPLGLCFLVCLHHLPLGPRLLSWGYCHSSLAAPLLPASSSPESCQNDLFTAQV